MATPKPLSKLSAFGTSEVLSIRGAREHNLQNVDLDLPKNKLVVFTGISGSGKSSLAFDTIYAEGQRRYVESLSAYARQFLGLMEKPDVDQITGLSPAISIDQKSASRNPRSTVGTVTEIYDYMRLLYARIGHPHCPICGREISQQSPQQIVDQILKFPARTKLMLLGTVIKDRKGEYSQVFTDLRKQGYNRLRVDGRVYSVDDDITLIKTNKHTIEAVIDRIVLPEKIAAQPEGTPASEEADALRRRLTESVEAALKLGSGSMVVAEVLDSGFDFPAEPKQMTDHMFSEKFACPVDNISLPDLEPRLFSFNSPHGACTSCTGLGTILEVEPELVLNPNLTINEGGILPWSRMAQSDTWHHRMLESVAKEHDFSLDEPISKLTDDMKLLLLFGSEELMTVRGANRQGRMTSFDTSFEGIVPNLMRRYKETDSDYIRGEIERYMIARVCPSCQGKRLKPEALSVVIDTKSIIEVTDLSITKALHWIDGLTESNKLSPRETMIAKQIVKELQSRLKFLSDVGLDYLTLQRNASTLSGGEAQRIRLASQIGSGLSGVLYVLDEPSIGLHQADNAKLITTLKELRDLGNSVIVVEHDEETMQESDYVVDFGPGAGSHGGFITAEGTPSEIMANPKSLTGQYLSGKKQVAAWLTTQRLMAKANPDQNEAKRQARKDTHLLIKGINEHNVKNMDVDIPLGKFVCVTGVSGSGKSTVVMDVLYKRLAQYFYHAKDMPGKHAAMEGLQHLDKVVDIDQSPIGRTPRSNPATYTGAFTPIRELFAQTQDARTRGYTSGRFSFNVKGGRCENCQGDGQIKIEMQFLPDVYVECEVCGGARYNREALEIHFKNKNISEVLNMTVEEALSFFRDIPPIANKLQTLSDVGLGYVRLGQSAPTLSGGEAQRVKLATELSKRATGQTLYILDEPTTGLHFADIDHLLLVLHRLVQSGNTVVVIEHNLDVIKTADWIIDLGPKGGDNGGKIIATGTPQQVAETSGSATGHYLKKLLKTEASRR
jgi:excinuclease ABC subunit A